MSNNINNRTCLPDRRLRYTRQTVVTNTFFQTPRFLTAGEFAGNKMSNNARMLYTLLLDRHRISVKNGWFDDNGEVYIYFKREEMEAQVGLSKVTVLKVMQELKELFLVEEKKQGLNKPNKIYLLTPVVGDDENLDPYLAPDGNYNPEETETSGDKDYIPQEVQELYLQTNENYTAGSIETVPQEVQDLYPNDNKLINNNISDNEGSKITTAATSPAGSSGGEHTTCSQIMKLYNELCVIKGLRSIRSISGKRRNLTIARFKEYGLAGFTELFEKVAASSFLCGSGERGWKADYDWLIAPTNMPKVLEGKYDDNQSNTPSVQMMADKPSQKNTQERHDPFLERAMTAYETAARTTTV